MSADIRPFGSLVDGRAVQAVRLHHGQLSVCVLTLGAIVQDVRLAGAPWPLTLGSDQITAYEGPMQYNGAIVGPVANRIAGAGAPCQGRVLQLEANENGRTSLHGGFSGTHGQIWQIVAASPDSLTLRLSLPDGQGGYPGNRQIEATYALTGAATLALTLTGTTDRPTLMNLANHSYWTLDGRPTVAGHTLQIAAAAYLPVDDDRIPIGVVTAVAGTRFDLNSPRQLQQTEDYDHNWCLAPAPRDLSFACRLTGQSGVRLTMATTEPGLQVYDAARLDTAPHLGLSGQPYGRHAGLAIEAQRWPNAPHQPDFPSVALVPGQDYRQLTRWTFERV